MDQYLGQILLFAGNFAPRGWAYCNGQLLAISQNDALFSLLGTTYGGDGRTTFALPDLRGRAPIHSGTGPGLTTRRPGNRSGTETSALNTLTMPNHFHMTTQLLHGKVQVNAVEDDANSDEPTDHYLAIPNIEGTNQIYSSNPAESAMKTFAPVIPETTAPSDTITLENTGSGRAFNNMQPILCINYIIALEGEYPSRS